MKYLILILSVVSSSIAVENDLRIRTTTGILKGKRANALEKSLRLFLGVPFAAPPVGNLRFRPPVPLDTADVEKDATDFEASCVQMPHVSRVINPLLHPNTAKISEDCLYLNIYVPENSNPALPLPVIVWLAGEGYDFADPKQFDGRYLAVEGQTIVVTISYRLSAFGFLSSLSEDAPGNVGLLDQRLALRWIRQNIDKFGGQSRNITLAGRFTGSMSAAIHAFSPLSKTEKLFDRIIMQSGVPDGDWAFDRSPLNSTYELAKAVQCEFPEISRTVDCLRNKPADNLLKAAMNLNFRFRPVFDFHLIRENTLAAVARGDYAPVDVMVGITRNEGSLCTIALDALQSPLYEKILNENLTTADFSDLIQLNMEDFFKVNDDLLNTLATYNYQKSQRQLRSEFIKFCGELLITSRSQKIVDEVSKRNIPVFMYEFAHRPSFSIYPDFVTGGHGEDILFFFALPLQLQDLPEGEVKLTKEMVTAFSNFALTGNPNGLDPFQKWPAFTREHREVMNFSVQKAGSAARRTTHDEAVRFWFTVIPEAQKDRCNAAPYAAELVADQETKDNQQGQDAFLGGHFTLPTEKIMIFGLLGICGFVLAMFLVSIGVLVKTKRASEFRRLE